jgi:hypothetical protein
MSQPDETVLTQIEFVKAFLRVGHLSWTEWETMDSPTRALFVEASEHLEIERAALVSSMQLSGTGGIARALSRVDGGERLVSHALQSAMDRLVARSSG